MRRWLVVASASLPAWIACGCDAPEPPAPPPAPVEAAPAPPAGAPAKKEASAEELRFRQEIVDRNLAQIQALAADPVVVGAVRDANAANRRTQAEIDEMDRKWTASAGADDGLVKPFLRNPCADLFRRTQAERPHWVEIFSMDGKGCNAALAQRTSDFWQGDEAKFRKSYGAGDGGTHVGDISFDVSSRAYVVQISVPVFDAGGKIGALTVSVKAAR